MVGFLTIVLATLLIICRTPESLAASIQNRVAISHSGMNARYAHLWMAQERGFFTKYGMDTDVIFVRTGPIQVASVASGDVLRLVHVHLDEFQLSFLPLLRS